MRPSSNLSIRDPRTQPQPGDKLMRFTGNTVNGLPLVRVRHVVSVAQSVVNYENAKGKRGHCSIKTWKDWARWSRRTEVI